MDFVVIKHTGGANRCSKGDIFSIEGKLFTVSKISNKYVYFGDKFYFPKNMFFRWVRLSLKYKKLREDSKFDAAKDKREGIIGYKPSMSLRYIVIVDNNENYHWLFANKQTSHSDLLLAFKVRYETAENYYRAVFGGFYNFRYSNALGPEEKPVLEIFGRSDSFGFNYETYLKVLPELKRLMNHIEIDDSWILTNYKK